MDLLAVKKEMNAILKSLPIQVPTRFIFLGRSFVTIEGMLHTINPEKEIIDIVKPAFTNWLHQSNPNKWKLVFKWIYALPFFRVLHSISDLLEAPQRFMAQKETQQQREFHFSMYENQKIQAFILGVIGLVVFLLGIYFQHSILSKVTVGLMGGIFVVYVVSSRRQRKWLKFME